MSQFKYSININYTKEIKAGQLQQINQWAKIYGSESLTSRKKHFFKEDTTDSAGSYLLRMELNKLVPSIVPMYWLKVKLNDPGVKRQYSNCNGHHKNKCYADKISFELYTKNQGGK